MRQDCGSYALTTLPLLGRTSRGPTKILVQNYNVKLPKTPAGWFYFAFVTSDLFWHSSCTAAFLGLYLPDTWVSEWIIYIWKFQFMLSDERVLRLFHFFALDNLISYNFIDDNVKSRKKGSLNILLIPKHLGKASIAAAFLFILSVSVSLTCNCCHNSFHLGHCHHHHQCHRRHPDPHPDPHHHHQRLIFYPAL